MLHYDEGIVYLVLLKSVCVCVAKGEENSCQCGDLDLEEEEGEAQTLFTASPQPCWAGC